MTTTTTRLVDEAGEVEEDDNMGERPAGAPQRCWIS